MNLKINNYLNKVKDLFNSQHLKKESLLSKEEFEQILSKSSKLLVLYMLWFFYMTF